MALDDWDQVRTAYQVARLGTVSAAAEMMGVHHATVIRHIDALESALGVKLFQRHARGYTATEAGQDLLRVADATHDQFAQLAGRLKGQGDGLSGDLVVTSLDIFSPDITPILVAYQSENPEIRVRFLTDERLFRLEYGEAHVAIRVGSAPNEPDNVVQKYKGIDMALVASKNYVAQHGRDMSATALKKHWFIGFDVVIERAPSQRWMQANVAPDRVRFKTSSERAITDAIGAGVGIGFMNVKDLACRNDLEILMPMQPEWEVPTWLVTHVDLHRTAKVQSILKYLKAAA